MAGQASDQKQANNGQRKQLQPSQDMVFTRGMSIQNMPHFSKLLETVTDCVIGLQYVWEYRSPSNTVQPHYQCKLCHVFCLQQDMLAHVKGWKHILKYLQKTHPDKISCAEKEAASDPAVRRNIKEIAADVEKMEGRGQLKVILGEPYDVPALKGLKSTIPKPVPPPPPLQRIGFGCQPFGSRLCNQRFQDGLPAACGPFSQHPSGNCAPPGFRGFSSRPGCREGSFSRGRVFHSNFRRSQTERDFMNTTPEKWNAWPGPTGWAPDMGGNTNALLNNLDTLRIENENDAQLVLRVMQRLTDLLMAYRQRSESTGSPMSNSMVDHSSSFSSLQDGSDEVFSLWGSPGFSDGPSRFYH